MSRKPEHILGRKELLTLDADGWSFAEGGDQLGGCIGCWMVRDDVMRYVFVADVDVYPEAWADSPSMQP